VPGFPLSSPGTRSGFTKNLPVVSFLDGGLHPASSISVIFPNRASPFLSLPACLFFIHNLGVPPFGETLFFLITLSFPLQTVRQRPSPPQWRRQIFFFSVVYRKKRSPWRGSGPLSRTAQHCSLLHRERGPLQVFFSA